VRLGFLHKPSLSGDERQGEGQPHTPGFLNNIFLLVALPISWRIGFRRLSTPRLKSEIYCCVFHNFRTLVGITALSIQLFGDLEDFRLADFFLKARIACRILYKEKKQLSYFLPSQQSCSNRIFRQRPISYIELNSDQTPPLRTTRMINMQQCF